MKYILEFLSDPIKKSSQFVVIPFTLSTDFFFPLTLDIVVKCRDSSSVIFLLRM